MLGRDHRVAGVTTKRLLIPAVLVLSLVPRNAASFSPLYQRSTRLLGIPDGVPAHATGSPSTLDFVLWNPNTLVGSGTRRECNRESVDRGTAVPGVYFARGAGM